MTDSFYYFFSAVPQVLAGILALFGVFVVFKIQTIKSDLLGIAQDIINKIEYLETSPAHLDKSIFDGTIGIKTEMVTNLNSHYKRNNLKGLKSIIDEMSLIEYAFDDPTGLFVKNYMDLYNYLQTLIRGSINLSIFTAIIITLSLAILPFGEIILQHGSILYVTFSLIIAGTIICLYGLIHILVASLKEHNSDASSK